MTDEDELLLELFPDEGRKEKPRKPPATPAPRPSGNRQMSPRDKLIDVLAAGRPLSAEQESLINAIQTGFALSESDPLWIMVLPMMLSRPDNGELRELIMSLKPGESSGDKESVARLREVGESQRDVAEAIHTLNTKLEKAVERGVVGALAKSDVGGIDQAALARAVSDQIGARLIPARMGLVAGAVAVVAALAFVSGVWVNKQGYDGYISELKGKVSAYETAVQLQQQGKR